MPHEYRKPKYTKKHVSKDHNRKPREKPKSLGLETTRPDSFYSKVTKFLYWCPKCNIPLLAKTCICDTQSEKIPLQQPYDVRPALKADYELISRLVKERFGDKVTMPKIIVLNKAGGLDRNDMVIANGIRFAWLSFDPSTRKFSFDIEAEALPFFIGKADKGIIDIIVEAKEIPDGRIGGKKIEIKKQDIPDGIVIIKYKSKYGTGILKGTTLKIKELAAVEPAKTMPNPDWDEAVAKNSFHLKNMERTAVREIRQNLTLKPLVNCSFSGGKDSTAVWHIAQKAGVTSAFFIDTGLEFPQTIEFVKSQNVEFIEKAGNFWQAVEKAGPPGKDHRWCCKLLKLNPLKVHLSEIGECLTVQGNRWYESWNRAELEAVTQNPNNPLQMNLSPIRSWRALDVFFYLWSREIPYNPLYEMGYERIGCYLCPAMLESELETLHKTHPEMADRWFDFLKRWADERGLPKEFVDWGIWRWKELPPKMKELVRNANLDLTEKPVKRSVPASVASLMPKVKAEDIVETETDFEKFRADFPMLSDLIYLDNGATSFSPKCVIDAAYEFDNTYRSNVGRGIHRLTRISTQKYWFAHEKVAKFINGEKGTTVFVKNSTEAINIVAHGLDFKEGDVIVTTILEHHSNILPWRELKKKGVEIRTAGLNPDLTLNMDEFAKLMDESVKLVTVTHASNVTGTVTPIAEISALCKKYGALLCVDGAQSVPHMAVDVEKLGIDYLAFSGHKMFGLMGTGVLWMRDANLEPLILGGGMIESVSDDSYVPAEGFRKYEAGTPNVSGFIGLGEAVDYLEKIGMEDIERRERYLTDMLIDGLCEIKGVHVHSCKKSSARIGAVSFTVDGYNPHEIAEWLDEEHSICVRSGFHCAEPLMRYLGLLNGTVRASLSFYNTESEIKTLIAVLKDLAG
ncbi:MAG: aminotransferase class V-fold PLP-dependent enzyme [Methanocorpusculum sp.]|nr:aminotransferase class V-fold PLP-dependent enzyme [Methanocorpusculum sp.]